MTITETGRRATKDGKDSHSLNLADAVRLWATPMSRDWKDGTAKSCENIPVNSMLGREVHMWPTPREFMYKDTGADRGKSNLGEVVGGSLNPYWVEWLMGFPIGWTDPDCDAVSELPYRLEPHARWSEEPRDIPRTTTNNENRKARLMALGNAVVPANVEWLGKMIIKINEKIARDKEKNDNR